MAGRKLTQWLITYEIPLQHLLAQLTNKHRFYN